MKSQIQNKKNGTIEELLITLNKNIGIKVLILL